MFISFVCMKRLGIVFIISVFLFNGPLLFSQSGEDKLKENISNHLLESLINFRGQNLKQLRYIANPAQTRKQLQQTRQAYKTCEYYLGIGNSVEFRKINGPNIPYDAFRGGASQFVEARGLQTLEEMVFQEPFDALSYEKEVRRLDTLLVQIYERGKNLAQIPGASFHQIIWEALKVEIYRVESLGITGFDTPQSGWAIQEIEPALRGMMGIVNIYSGSEYVNKNMADDLGRLMQDAITYARKNKSFDKFDRLHFIREFLHPISEQIHAIQKANGWMYQVRKSGVNPSAKNLWDYLFFDNDFFRYRSSPTLVAAGKTLFHDKKLSPGGVVSCASCHIPEYGFADNKAFSLSIEGKPLRRNTPGLWNIAFQTKFYLDGRALRIEDQFMEVIHNPEEMGSSLDFIVKYVAENPLYINLFKEALGRKPGKYEVLSALEAYVRSLFSFSSEFDRYMRRELPELKPEVVNGFNLFAGKAKCATCHFLPLFNGLLPPFYDETEFEILGTPVKIKGVAATGTDLGRYEKTGVEFHKRAFKTGGIRNAHLNAPYMHNGVFETLEEVLNFYNHGGGIGNGIRTEYQTLPSDSLRLSSKEIQDILSFIQALEDTVTHRTK